MLKVWSLLFVLLLSTVHMSVRKYEKMDQQLLRFELSADKTRYLVGEPIELTFTLTNDGNMNVKGRFEMGFLYNNPEVWYRKGEQRFQLYISHQVETGATTDYLSAGFEELGPGSNKSKTERLLYSIRPAGLVLGEPVVYEFQAKYNFMTDKVEAIPLESNFVRVVVEDPPESERETLKRWSDPELLDFLQGNEGYVPEAKVRAGMKKAAAFMEEYSNSIYVGAAKEGLLSYLSSRARLQRITAEEKTLFERLKSER